MTKQSKNNNSPFRDYYESLPGNKKADFLEKITKTCEISEPTFYRRLKTPDFFSGLEKKAIALICGEKLNKLFPEGLKKVVTVLLLFFSFQSKSQLSDYLPTIQPDKFAHFSTGAFISTTVYHSIDNKKKAFTWAFLAGTAANFFKEGCDYSQGRQFSWNDIKAGTFGALIGTVSYKVVLNFKAKARGDMSAFENIGPYKEGLFDKEVTDSVTHPRNQQIDFNQL